VTTLPPDTAEVTTDVLVVGGGLAALRAAWSARQAGARVLVAVKRKLGQSGSSANTSGGFAAASPDLNPADDARQHYADTVAGGGYVNDRTLARVLAEEAPTRLRELVEVGARFQRRNGGYYLSPSGDHRHPRVLVPEHIRGTDLTLPLRAAVLATGVDVLENVLVVELLLDDGRAVGAVGLRRDRVGLVVIRAGATILAAGGAGRLFSVTSNPVDVTGGGYALALEAGAELRDMEFIQFYPWRVIRPFGSSRVPVQPSTFVAGAKLYNARGERFMERYDPVKKEAATRDISARGIFDQIRAGQAIDGGVVLDVSDVPDEVFRHENRKVVERLDPHGIDYRTIPLIIAPEAHFVMGGVRVDEHGASTRPGLYACGETAGGVHGGNRLNSNAVPETQVFGHRAGQGAARYAAGRAPGRVDAEAVRRWAARLGALRAESSDVTPELKATLAAFREAMWLGLGIVRTEAGLGKALAEAVTTRDRGALSPASTLGDLIAATELVHLTATATAMAASALCRTESRAAHYREDHPTADPAWVATVAYEDGRAIRRSLPVASDDEVAAFAAPPPHAPRPDEFVE
jgi:succinate dehydrogenase/fumarate reductase flavoprotein subunit